MEKALKGLHLRHGQQAWGHGLGRSCRDLPPAVSAALRRASAIWRTACASSMPYIPTRCPDSLPDGARPTISAGSRARTPTAMPVRSLTGWTRCWRSWGRSWGLCCSAPGARHGLQSGQRLSHGRSAATRSGPWFWSGLASLWRGTYRRSPGRARIEPEIATNAFVFDPPVL